MYLQRDTGRFGRGRCSHPPTIPEIHNDLFGYGAYSLARAMTHWGQRAYLYVFAYAEKEKRGNLGAYHGEELYFLSNSFPTDWVHDQDEESLGQTVRIYWTQFAKTGNPNFSGLAEWPAYAVREDQYLELGRKVALRQVPERLKTLEQIMASVIGDTTGSATGSLSTN